MTDITGILPGLRRLRLEVPCLCFESNDSVADQSVVSSELAASLGSAIREGSLAGLEALTIMNQVEVAAPSLTALASAFREAPVAAVSSLRVLRLHGYAEEDDTGVNPLLGAFEGCKDGRWDGLQVLDLKKSVDLHGMCLARGLAQTIDDGCFGTALQELNLSCSPFTYNAGYENYCRSKRQKGGRTF